MAGRTVVVLVLLAAASPLAQGLPAPLLCLDYTCHSWTATWNGPGLGIDRALDAVVSPDGATLYSAGVQRTTASPARDDMLVIAHDADTGAELWRALSNPAGSTGGSANGIAIAPDGATVFATGSGNCGTATGSDYMTAAFDAATGTRLWTSCYDFVARTDVARDVATSPDGATVYVTGSSFNTTFTNSFDYATVAYSAATGAQIWVARYNYDRNSDEAYALAVSPASGAVYVTGRSYASLGGYAMATVAYSSGGSRMWEDRAHASTVGSDPDYGEALAVSADGSRVAAVGWAYSSANAYDYYTVVYDSAGSGLWSATYDAAASTDQSEAATFSPDGGALYVTGRSHGTASASVAVQDMATVAYDVASGATRWVARYDGDGQQDYAMGVATDESGLHVYVGGTSQGASTFADHAVVAYEAVTGTELGAARYDGGLTDYGNAFALDASTGRAFVVGHKNPASGSGFDLLVTAYEPGLLATVL